MENKKTKIISMIAIIALVLTVITATYAYFQAQTGEGSQTDVKITSNTVDTLSFETGSAINFNINQDNFAQGKGNQSGTTFAKAILTANNKTNSATNNYNLYLNISDNDFGYTDSATYPELLLTIKDGSNNEITNIDGLTYKTVTDGKGTTVKGFDITTEVGLITILNNRTITTTSTKTEEWNITVTFVNYNKDQSANAGKSFNGQILISKEAFEDYTPGTINTLSATKSGSNLSVDLVVEQGTNELDKYYYAIEKIDSIALLDNESKVQRLSNRLASNTITYVESNSSTYTFTNIDSNSDYMVYAYAIDNKKVKTNTYDYKYRSNYTLPWIRSVNTSQDSTSLTLTLTAVNGTNNVAKYYFSKDNGKTYVESTSNSYTFNDLSYGNYYKFYFYVEDIMGEKSNAYVNRFNYVRAPEPEIEIIVTNGTVTTEDGEIILFNDPGTLSKYLSILESAVKAENITGYSILGVIDVNFINIIDADVDLQVPEVKIGDTVLVKKYNNGSWSSLDTTVIGGNQISVKFTEPGVYEILKKVS